MTVVQRLRAAPAGLRLALLWLAALVVLGACEPVQASLLRRRAEPDAGVSPPVDPCPSPTVQVRSLVAVPSAWPRLTAAGTRLVVVYSDLRAGVSQALALEIDPATLGVVQQVQLSQTMGLLPAVTWDGQRLVAVWVEASGVGGEGPVVLGRFDDAFALVGALLQLTTDGRLPYVVWNGAAHAVTWQDSTLVWQGFAGLVNGDGTLLRAGQNVCNWGDCLSTPQAAWNGEAWAVTWQNDGLSASSSGGYDVGFRLLSATGDLLTEPLAVTTTGGSQAIGGIASDGDGFLVAHAQRTPTGEVALFASHLDRAATLLDSVSVADLPLTAGSAFGPPDLLWDDGRFAMAWVEGPASSAVLVLSWLTSQGSEFGRVSVTPLPAPPGSVGGPTLARLGADYFIVWFQSDAGVKELKVARVSCGG